MPIYEFVCQECGSQFEKLVFRINAIDDVVCPSCGTPHVKKKISTFSSKTSNNCAPGGT